MNSLVVETPGTFSDSKEMPGLSLAVNTLPSFFQYSDVGGVERWDILHSSPMVLPEETWWVAGPDITARAEGPGYGESCMMMSMGSSTTSSTTWLILGMVLTLHSYFPLSVVVVVLMSSVQSSACILGLVMVRYKEEVEEVISTC